MGSSYAFDPEKRPHLNLACKVILVGLGLFAASGWLVLFHNLSNQHCKPLAAEAATSTEPDRIACLKSCRMEIVESIPENLTFGSWPMPRSTYEAWRSLIKDAEVEIDIAAYKSSLRGKHVLNEPSPSSLAGEKIFDYLLAAGRDNGVKIRMVENFPSKDPGDNADGRSLARRGAINSRPLNYGEMFGAGAMHSKFIVVDRKHFYLGSANLDWRSLSQKMELGVLITDCPCLAVDVKKLFETYWTLSRVEDRENGGVKASSTIPRHEIATTVNRERPLKVMLGGVESEVYLAASPQYLNGPGRTWDLDAILDVINGAQEYLYIHVMDYIPMTVYQNPQQYWPVIDDAVRRAAVERKVEVKLLVAALHFVPKMLHFLKSLKSISKASAPGSVDVKIFKVPVMTDFQTIIARDRRTHNKFVVSESEVIIGTSNWCGDYFQGTTGAALVVHQRDSDRRPFVWQMRDIFVRDWYSDYAHPLSKYMKTCANPDTKLFNPMCEVSKSASGRYENQPSPARVPS